MTSQSLNSGVSREWNKLRHAQAWGAEGRVVQIERKGPA